MRWYAIRALRVRGADGQTMRNKFRRLRRKWGRRWGTLLGRWKRIGGRYVEKGVGEMAKGKACADIVRTARGARGKKEVIKGRVQKTKGKSYEGERKCAGARHVSGRRQRCKEEAGRGKDSGQALKARKKHKQRGISSLGRTRAGCIPVRAVSLVAWYMQVGEKHCGREHATKGTSLGRKREASHGNTAVISRSSAAKVAMQ